ncbi:MAG: RDD family protein [Nitrospirota bacterium]
MAEGDGRDNREGGQKDLHPEDEDAPGEVKMPSELDEEAEEEYAADLPPAMVAKVAPEERIKASVLNRSIARTIDILIALLLARLPGYIGFFSGILYVGIADGLMGGRSIGKRVIGLRVYMKKDGSPGDFRASILRNSTMAVLYTVALIPWVGWALGILGLGFELILIVGSPDGARLGDEIAGTVVRDEKT